MQLSSVNVQLLPLFTPQLRSRDMALLDCAKPALQVVSADIEIIRILMLQALGGYGEKKFPGMIRRVRYAPDVQGLLYVRSDVIAILATTYDEAIAREKIVSISGRFNGLLPQSLTKKSSFKSQ